MNYIFFNRFLSMDADADGGKGKGRANVEHRNDTEHKSDSWNAGDGDDGEENESNAEIPVSTETPSSADNNADSDPDPTPVDLNENETGDDSETNGDDTIEPIEGNNTEEEKKLTYDFTVPGEIEPIKQETDNACWATLTTMMDNWKKQSNQTVQEYIKVVGEEFLPYVETGIPTRELAGFCSKAGLRMAGTNAEYPVSFYFDTLKAYGPIWVIGLESATPRTLHGRLLIGIKGDGSATSTKFIIVDPVTGSRYEEDLNTFITKTENVVKTLDAIEGVQIPLLIYFEDSYDDSCFAGTVISNNAIVGSTNPPSVSPDSVARLLQYEFENADEINSFFATETGDFIDWFNTNHAGKGAFASRPGFPSIKIDGVYRSGSTKNVSLSVVKDNFRSFWNQLPFFFEKRKINLIEFITLMTSPLNEVRGNMTGRWPEYGNTLSYFYKLYNLPPYNKNAQTCFNDSDYETAHSKQRDGSDKPYYTMLAGVAGREWASETYPAGFSDNTAPDKSGYIREADFYKFRGRGVIQITFRTTYVQLVKAILNYSSAGTSTIINSYKGKWATLFPSDNIDTRCDRICTISTNEDWDELFSDNSFLAISVREFSNLKNSFLKSIGRDRTNPTLFDPEVLNGDHSVKGSIAYVGAMIGWKDYGNNIFRPRVMQLLNSIFP